jgi:F-type H+-transporting ATPase subunit c
MRVIKSAVLAVGLILLAQGTASAQGGSAPAPEKLFTGPFSDFRALGAGLVIVGAALGIGGLTRSAVESMARQPEMAGNIQQAMIISAALIEGVTFFALIVILLQQVVAQS